MSGRSRHRSALARRAVPPKGSASLRAYAELAEAVHCPVMLLGPQGEILAANRAMRERLGGRVAATLRECAAEYAEALGGRFDRHASVTVARDCQGQRANETVHLAPFDGGACITVEDRTRLAALESAHAQTTRLASLGFMVAGVCHELSNPLAAVSSMLQILQSRRGVTPETLDRGLASIAANIARVLAITRKLGDFSRVGAEGPIPVAIDDAMSEAIMLLRHSAWGGAVRVDYRGAGGSRALACPGQLQQVLFNILLNAAQAMQGTGCIEAEARTGPGARLSIEVRDDGPGIAPEAMPHVFEPFFTTKRAGEGTGLGLAISSEIVHEMGGRISIESGPRGGARVIVELPGHEA
jgi:two-component system NtrC family sensor kinase